MSRGRQFIETSLLALTVACIAGPASAQTKLPDITLGQKKPPVVHHAPQPTAKPVQPRVAAQPAAPAPRPAQT
ncbi:MAG: hypothetical protein WBS22_04500, partial [Methylocystis sp.]